MQVYGLASGRSLGQREAEGVPLSMSFPRLPVMGKISGLPLGLPHFWPPVCRSVSCPVLWGSFAPCVGEMGLLPGWQWSAEGSLLGPVATDLLYAPDSTHSWLAALGGRPKPGRWRVLAPSAQSENTHGFLKWSARNYPAPAGSLF